VKVHDSARKHGIDPADAVHAADHAVFVADLEEDSPARQLRLGFDASGRLLEIVVLRFDSGNELLIHAMKARPRYLDLLD
jgi:predicted hotdog family 3-hydroxylacyl-ACP dehydratase